MKASAQSLHPHDLNWGFVGTGNIANWMAQVVQGTPGAQLAAVASRNAATAAAFATRHRVPKAFDSWAGMLAWEGIDAVYVATPTALREEICVAAAHAGKHVLAEKPFASLPSLLRITAAARTHNVAFMDATHFVHHPRTRAIHAQMNETTGPPHALDSSFLVSLGNRDDIRYSPDLEPLGALGDLGWYNMRATLEYLAPASNLRSVSARVRRDPRTEAIIGGIGALTFEDSRESAWRCSFEADAPVIELRLCGSLGQIVMDNFVGEEPDRSASYRYARAATGDTAETLVNVASNFSGPSLMFQDFAAAVVDHALRDRWILASERTQALLDAVYMAAES